MTDITSVDITAATEVQLVEMVLGAPGIGTQLVAAHGLLGVARLSPHVLAERAEMALPDATRLAAAFELGRRLQMIMGQRRKRLNTPKDIATFFAPRFTMQVHEELWIGALDARNGVRGVSLVSRGGLHGTWVRPADVLRVALELGAVNFVMVHNHPSGDPTPSDDDVELTNEIEHRAHLIGIELKDHVIVCPSGKYASVFRR
ncbi:JAB domain-containing protein [Sorangium sp. So ce834]|uniref:JAB domain-containing protein n=1 Tax=Sorangium sp. So ce834 TaxID=3133321 RepID=UPI003F5E2B1F